MLCLKLLHAGHESLAAFDGHGVVAACTEAAYVAMSLHAYHALACGEGHEFVLQFLILGLEDEGDVHAGTAVLLGCADEELVAVDFAIHNFRTLLGKLFHCLDTALLLDPLEVLQGAVDGNCGRRVEHTALLDVCAVVEHGRDGSAHLAQEVFLNDAEGDACHAEVLLSTAVNHAVLADIDRTGEDVATHVCNHGHRAVEVCENLGAVDGVVRRDMEVVGISRDGEVLGDVGKVPVGTRCHLHHFAEELGLLLRLGSPDAGVQIGSLLLQEVVGHHAELQTCTAAEEYDAVAFGDAEQLLEKGYSLVNYGLEVLGTMTCLHQGEAASLELEAGSSGCLHHFLGKNGRAGIEIVLLHCFGICVFPLYICAAKIQKKDES